MKLVFVHDEEAEAAGPIEKMNQVKEHALTDLASLGKSGETVFEDKHDALSAADTNIRRLKKKKKEKSQKLRKQNIDSTNEPGESADVALNIVQRTAHEGQGELSAVVARLESALQEKNITSAYIQRLEDNLEEMRKLEKAAKQKFKLLQPLLEDIHQAKLDMVETLEYK